MCCAVCLPCCRYVENALAGAILQSSTFVNTSTSCGGFCLAAGAVYIGRCVDCAVVDVAFRNSSVVAAVNDSLNAQCSTLPQTVASVNDRGGCSPRALGSALAMNFDATPALMNRVQVVQFSAVSCGVILGGAISIVSTSTTRRLVLQVRPLCFSILSASDCLLSRFAIGCEVQHVLTLAGQAVDISRGSAALFGGSANSLINPSSELTGVGIHIFFDNAGIYVIDSSFADLSSAASGNAAANIFHQVHVPELCFMSSAHIWLASVTQLFAGWWLVCGHTEEVPRGSQRVVCAHFDVFKWNSVIGCRGRYQRQHQRNSPLESNAHVCV